MSFSFSPFFTLIDALVKKPGCRWNQAQSFASICHYLIEEVYEIIDADQTKDKSQVEEELADVLFNALYVVYAAIDKYSIDLEKVINIATSKVIRRHPHVFDEPKKLSFEQLRIQWERIKAKEREGKIKDPVDIAKSMPSMLYAMKLYELMRASNYVPQLNLESKSDQILKLLFDGQDQYQNMEEEIKKSVSIQEKSFREYLEKKKPEMVP